jgi:hypothetical protein
MATKKTRPASRIEHFNKVVKNMFTESDNSTFDYTKILAFIAVIIGLSLQVYSVVFQGQHFDMNTFGIGIGALFAGLAAALGFKKETDISIEKDTTNV